MTNAKYPIGKNVFEAAKDRIRWVFNEFDNVIVNNSGGKDSTCVLNLALQVAEEEGRLPLKVMFLDQEAEWQATIDYQRKVFARAGVDPLWLQVPFKLFNATSPTKQWLECWEPGQEWVREKEDISIKENVFGTDRFTDMFSAVQKHYYPNESSAYLTGVRCEESPARRLGLTSYATYKHVTWGSVGNKKLNHYTFHPIYDWTYRDVWKSIHDNNWDYCKLYDYYYQYGIPVMKMRVSNVHHETAVRSLFFLHDIEPETWRNISTRLSGLNSACRLGDAFFCPKECPPMFKDLWEYRDHLLENLILNEKHREIMRRTFAGFDERYLPEAQLALVHCEIKTILTNDFEGAALSTFTAAHSKWSKNHGKNARREEEKAALAASS